jgi:hypothetical protein
MENTPSHGTPQDPDPGAAPPSIGALICNRCGVEDVPTVLHGTGGHAWKAVCAHCGRYLRWLSRYTPQEIHERRRMAAFYAMQRLPVSAAQLDYLTILEDPEPPPTDMGTAWKRIEVLKQQKGWG